jgi:hypothetical protein
MGQRYAEHRAARDEMLHQSFGFNECRHAACRTYRFEWRHDGLKHA